MCCEKWIHYLSSYNESRILKCVHKIFTSDLSNFMIFSAFKSVSRVVYFIVIIISSALNISIHVYFIHMSRGYDVVLWIDSYDVTKASYIRHTSQYLVDSAHAALLETHQAVPFSCSICYLVKIHWNITVMHIELEFYKLSIYMTLPIHSTECYKAWN